MGFGRKGMSGPTGRARCILPTLYAYQSKKSGHFTTEGKPTQKAERYGFSIGASMRKNDIEKRNREGQNSLQR